MPEGAATGGLTWLRPRCRAAAGRLVLPFAMAKQPTKQQPNHSWAIYHIRGTPAQFVGIVHDAPDEQSAIEKSIEEYKCRSIQRWRLIAQPRD